MRPEIDAATPARALLLFLLAGAAAAQTGDGTAKRPRPLPVVLDVETAEEAAPLEAPEPAVEKLAAPAAAPSSDGAGAELAALVLPPIERDRVYVDEPEDGEVWARGATYKAGFRRDGAVYVPCFGSRAPANHPIAFRVEAVVLGEVELAHERAARPRRQGEAVLFDRGAFVERYELAPESVEQTFVFPGLPARGALAVRVGVETDLAFAAGPDGFEFAHELGRVVYGRATVFDRAGRGLALESERVGDAIEIRVPAEFLATAEFPVTIDPVISTFAVDTTAADDWLPSLAYDVGTNRYLAVYEERFSDSDNDVFARVLSGAGANLGGAYVDSTLANWRTPEVANNNLADQFLVVATVGAPGSDRIVRGRTWAAASSVQSAMLTISGSESGDRHQADVGGDPVLVPPTYYCVAWIRELVPTNGDVHYRLVRSDGTLVGPGTQVADNTSGDDVNLDVSISDGGEPFATQAWNVVWQRIPAVGASDLRGAQIAWDGVLATPSFSIDATSNTDSYPSASSLHDGASGERDWIVAFTRPVGGDDDTMVRFLNGSTVGALVNLSSLESAAGSGTFLEDQRRPSADCDGSRFAVAYEESTAASGTNVYIASFDALNGEVLLNEGHRALGVSSSAEEYVDVTSRHGAGGTNGRFAAVWTRWATAVSADIHGGLYDVPPFQAFCLPGVDGPFCPCANPPSSSGRGCNNSAGTGGARLTASGIPSLSADGMVLVSTGELPTALSVFNQGDAFASATFGQGVRCAGGALKRLYTKAASGGTASAPGAGDPSISARSAALGDPIPAGAARYYYVYYRDPVVLGGCPSSSTFNATQAIQAMWSP